MFVALLTVLLAVQVYGDEPCKDFKCANGGQCIISSNGSKAACNCRKPYFGEHCEEIDPCAKHPCKNGGVCKERFNVGYCVCPTGWTGEYCGNSTKDLCTPNPCHHGGNCSVHWGAAICDCPAPYSGDYCNSPFPPPDPCNQSGLVTCSRGIKTNTSSPCPFNEHLAACAEKYKCEQRLRVWCTTFFPSAPQCIPKQCSQIPPSPCRDPLYQRCYTQTTAAESQFDNKCLFNQALVNCTVVADCDDLRQDLCARAEQVCNRIQHHLPKELCPPSNKTSV
eukprot:TRINITY_DN58164_c0_g1_i1.p1 TRINITY_DN58164_c0_g1~~TRINITY_DN58164_c0_g1_i1.p1  ORF type:complete len:287 (+),score=27.16 TRINITY_DN58164_c0_g1_i1:27-863(+)